MIEVLAVENYFVSVMFEKKAATHKANYIKNVKRSDEEQR